MVSIQENKRIQKIKRGYKRKEGSKRGFSEVTKNKSYFKRVLSAYFKLAGMIH